MQIAPIQSLIAVLGVQALSAAAVVSLHRCELWLRRALPFIISVAVGVLLATGAAHLLPEAVGALGNRNAVWVTLVATMLALYAFERIFQLLSGVRAEPLAQPGQEQELERDCELHGPHHHHGETRPATLLLGSLTHSLVDGTSVAAAFAVDTRVGWITALAVGLHEVPHRLGDFALLVHMGVKQRLAAWLAIGAGGLSLLGWAIVSSLGAHGAGDGSGNRSGDVAWLLPVSAGSFLYISLVDLLPELQSERRPAAVLWQIVCLAAGVALALGLTHMKGA